MKALSARPARPVRSARSARSPRRLAAALVAGATAVAFLGGCGFQTRQQAAAVVNGEVISQSDVQTTYEQLQTAQLRLHRERRAHRPHRGAPARERRRAVGRLEARRDLRAGHAAIPDATESTKDFVAAVSLIQSQTMTPAQMEAYRADLAEGRHLGEPPLRRDRAAPSEGPVYFSIGPVAAQLDQARGTRRPRRPAS